MGRHHDKRATKVRRLERRRRNELDRKQRQAEREPEVFVGVEDGAPDDQLNPQRGPDAWHTVGVVIAPTTKLIDDFCQAIRANAGHPAFVLAKWNGGSKDHRQPRQLSFARGFVGAIRAFPEVRTYVFAIQAKYITKLWDMYITGGNPDKIGQIVTRKDGKDVVRWGPMGVRLNNKPQFVEFEMDLKRAPVVFWTAMALGELYTIATERIGHKPIWHLLCDRLPSDSSGRGLAVIVKLLSGLSKERITLHTKASDDHRPDNDGELLADCVATWAKDYLEHPERPTSKALQAIFDDQTLTDGFNLRRKYVGEPPPETTTATSESPSP